LSHPKAPFKLNLNPIAITIHRFYEVRVTTVSGPWLHATLIGNIGMSISGEIRRFR
jgi:hypothetical protein